MVAMVPQTAMLTGSGYLANYLPADANIHDVGRKFQEFRSALLTAFRATDLEAEPTAKVPSKLRIQNTFMKENTFGLKALLEDSFLQFIGSAPPQESEVREASMETAADVRFPQEWFPNTRQFQRTLHLHVGPTNSGKTYHALKRLEESDNGVYAGPLRLLAQEIFERMNAKGLTCNLVTGDDIRVLDETARFQSSTMEMVDVSTNFDVCVIDEIQMIGDENRGWAWTYALMGVRAKEVHMCGEERTVDLIKRLAAALGDELIIHNYKRLGPLEVQAESLQGDLKKIEKGDCIVTFSRRNIFALKRSIEEQTGKRCAVIYGSLPPETRSTQAQLFNDQDSEYDILVASDAVGMGLNLYVCLIRTLCPPSLPSYQEHQAHDL